MDLPAPTPEPAPPAGEPVVLRRMRVAMGPAVVIEARGASAKTVQAGVAAAFAAVAQVAARLHPQRPGSDLERIAGAALGAPVPVHVDTFTVLRFAQRLHASSGGIFDPCLPCRPGRLSDLQLTDAAGPQVICQAPLALDCGGIGKGFAVDCAIEALRGAGCDSGLVNAGGDLRVFGARQETILLRRSRTAYVPLGLHEAALAVSDRDAPYAPSGHRGYYARTAAAATRRYAAVRAGSAMAADALTKCVLLAPPALARQILSEFDAECLA